MKNLSLQIKEDEENSLLEFLSVKLQISKKKVKKQLLDGKRVFVNQRLVWIAKHPLRCGDTVTIQLDNITKISERKNNGRDDIPIIYDDGDVIVVNKPSGLLSNGSRSVEDLLRKKLHMPELECVHRLDTDTSGCLALAQNATARDYMLQLFRTHQIKKIYHVIVYGFLETPNMKITTPLDGQSAITNVKTISARTEASYLHVELYTGRTHQIRRHLYSIGHPVLGDKLYGTGRRHNEKEMMVTRQMLHAYIMEWENLKKQQIKVKASLPTDFKETLALFGLD